MPGSKRRIDEDTWLLRQSKKFKFHLPAEIHQTTLATLRQGSRNFFNPPAVEQVSIQVNGRQRNFSNSNRASCHFCWTMNRNALENCSFCEKAVCHLSTCHKCNNSFCLLCGNEKYDEQEKFVCFGCM